MKKFVVVEDTGSYTICHGSGLTWEAAHVMVMSQMLHDTGCTEDGKLHNVSVYLLNVNEPGLWVSYEYDDVKTNYYILEDPGKPDVCNKE